MFFIGGNDYSNHVLADGSYSVFYEEQYEPWQDGNYKERRIPTGNKIRGSFTMFFETLSEYDTFISDLNNSRNAEGASYITIRVNNRPHGSDVLSAYCYIDLSPARKKNDLNQDVMLKYTVGVREA